MGGMRTATSTPLRIVLLLASLLAAAACSSVYYRTMEAFGKEKRHLMVDRVEEARDEQEDAKEQFQTTLDRFKALTGAEGGDLEDAYRRLAGDYEASEDQAQAVRDRIDSVQEVADDMFDEWKDEIGQIENPDYRVESQRLLAETEARYQDMIAAMLRAEEKMDPVLEALRDQVLFLKHNLNAKLVASLQSTVVQIEGDVRTLIEEMEASIAEANQFIEGMQQDA